MKFSEENNKLAQTIVDNSLTKVCGKDAKLTDNTLIVSPIAIARTIIEDEFDDRNLAKVLRKEFTNLDIREFSNEESFKMQILEELNKFDNVILFSYNAVTSPKQVEFINAVLEAKEEVTVISLKGPMDFNKYQNLNNYLCLYEYTPNSIRTVVKYFKGEVTPLGKLPIKL